MYANRFHYMAMSDERQRFMPTPEDRESGEPLAYKEAVLLKNPTNPDFNGEVKITLKHTNYQFLYHA